MISKEKKTQIIAEYGRKEGDTGSPEVQVALLTERIKELTEHLRFDSVMFIAPFVTMVVIAVFYY